MGRFLDWALLMAAVFGLIVVLTLDGSLAGRLIVVAGIVLTVISHLGKEAFSWIPFKENENLQFVGLIVIFLGAILIYDP